MRKAISELVVGDLVDLEGDRFADPNKNNPSLECEYQEVIEIEQESSDCIRIDFADFDSVGFPPYHMVEVL